MSKATSRIAVVGIDLGSSWSRVALCRQGKVDVLQNDAGSRKTPSMVAFSHQKRLVGSSAKSQLLSNPQQTFTEFHTLLGRTADDLQLAELRSYLHYEVTEADKALATADGVNRLAIPIPYVEGEEPVQVLPEHLSSMLLRYLHTLAEREAGGLFVEDCVVTVPDFFTEKQKQMMMVALKLAKWKPLKLMNESTALALYYGFLRPMPATPIKVLFVDMGHTHLTACVGEFKTGEMQILSRRWAGVGGRDLDQALYAHLAAEIATRFKLDVSTNTKAQLKLQRECERVKAVLSANTSAKYHIEYLMNDTDVNGVITRKQFEAAIAALKESVLAPVRQVLEDAKVAAGDLHSVEIVGGSVRVPWIQDILSASLGGASLSKTCDGDESLVRGCALQCAMLSTSFKVKEFGIKDCNLFPVALARDEEEPVVMFGPLTKFPVVKKIGYQTKEDFSVRFTYDSTNEAFGIPAGVMRLIATAKIQGVADKIAELKIDTSAKLPKVEVRVKMDKHGLVLVTSAELLERYQKEEGSAKWFIRRVPLKFTQETTNGLTADQTEAVATLERRFQRLDDVVVAREAAFNDLESAILDTRAELEDGTSGVADYFEAGVTDQLLIQLETAEDWAYEHVHDDVKLLRAKLGEIHAVTAPARARQAARQLLDDALQEYTLFLETCEGEQTEVADSRTFVAKVRKDLADTPKHENNLPSAPADVLAHLEALKAAPSMQPKQGEEAEAEAATAAEKKAEDAESKEEQSPALQLENFA